VANIPPQLLLEAPPVPPRPYGLFDVALGPMPFPSEPAVGGGVQYVPDTCEDDVFLYAMNCPPVSGTKTFSPVETAVSGAPFSVITSYTCNVIGFSMDEAEQRVRTRMSLREQRAVERRVWQGQTAAGLGLIPGLFRSALTIGPASCPTDAIAQLEQVLADNAVVGGIIHARPYMSAHLSQAHVLYHGRGNQLLTDRGTVVCFGEGYDGTGPANQPVSGSAEYMYATGRVLIWQDSEIFVSPPQQVLNKSTNDLNLLGERVYAVAIECGIWAIQVTRNCATTGAT